MKKTWYATIGIGGVIGALNLAHYLSTAELNGVETPFGLFPGGFPLAALLGVTSGNKLAPNLIAMLLLGLGIIAGAGLSARLSGELSWVKVRAKRLSTPKVFQAATGGILIGSGVWMAEGCLIKHTLSGAPGLMLSSWLTLAGIVGGIWLAAKVAGMRD